MTEDEGQQKLYVDPVGKIIRIGDENGVAVGTFTEVRDGDSFEIQIQFLDAYYLSMMRGALAADDLSEAVVLALTLYGRSPQDPDQPTLEFDPPYLVN